MKLRPRELYDLANQISMRDVMYDFFHTTLPEVDRPYKIYCPFGVEHRDGGIDRAFRYYPSTNTAYCFSIHGFFTPVRLMAMKEDLSFYAAANLLIEHYSIDGTRTPEIIPCESTRIAYLQRALMISLTSHPKFEKGQYAPAFSEALHSAFSDPPASDAAESELRVWYSDCRKGLAAVLDREVQ